MDLGYLDTDMVRDGFILTKLQSFMNKRNSLVLSILLHDLFPDTCFWPLHNLLHNNKIANTLTIDQLFAKRHKVKHRKRENFFCKSAIGFFKPMNGYFKLKGTSGRVRQIYNDIKII